MLTRRSAMQAMGAALLLSGPATAARAQQAPSQAAPARPPRLRPGDTVGLIQPAGFATNLSGPEASIEAIRAMGLVPKLGRHVYDRHGYLAGTDESRAADINAMFGDPTVRAIFTARGGWGSARALPYVNWDVVKANPKLLIGFSDITALHLAIAAKAGFPTIHAPNAETNWGPQTRTTFRQLAFDGALPFYGHPSLGADPMAPAGTSPIETFRPGQASGRLIGGNLTVLSTMMGTPYLPDFDGAILFLEDVDEAIYRIDRMLNQLALAGVLRRAAGIVFGRCSRCGSGVGSGGFTLSDVLGRHFRPLGIPVFAGAMIGHIANQLSIPVGVRAEIDAGAGTIRILEPAVA